MVAPRFTWRIPPETMIGKLDAGNAKMVSGLAALGDVFAARLEAAAKSGAPWSDDTGAARAALLGVADKSATGVAIRLSHGVEYGRYLETGTSRMRPYPIIQPTIEAHLAAVSSALEALISGAF